MMIKENFILSLAGFGLFVILYDRRLYLKQGLATIIISLIVFLIIVKIVIPYFNGWESLHFSLIWQKLIQADISFLRPDDLKYANMVFNSGVFMPSIFFTSRSLVLFVLPILERLLMSNHFSNLVWFHYNLTFLPLGIIAIFTFLHFYSGKFFSKFFFNIKSLSCTYTLLSVIFFNLFYAMPMPAYQPWRERFNEPQKSEINMLLEELPPKAAVAVSAYILPHLFNRLNISESPTISKAEYILILEKDESWRKQSLKKALSSALTKVYFKNSAGFILYKSK